MKKSDAAIYLIVLIAAVGLLTFLRYSGGGQALTARIYVAGELFESVNLRDNTQLQIQSPLGHNIVEIEDGGARMLLADCRSQDCIRMGLITRPGQVIACLPNRVVIRLEGTVGEDDFDAFAG